jgi:hypothetical protein
LAAQNIHAKPAVYCEDLADEVRTQLLQVDGVLVWVNPIQDGRPRFELDVMLRGIASRGIWVSTHPDVTKKMGVKEVLYTTRHVARIRVAIPLSLNFGMSFPTACRRRGLASSSRTAAMAASVYGELRLRTKRPESSPFSKRCVAACREMLPSMHSCPSAERISWMATASSTRPSSRDCRMG